MHLQAILDAASLKPLTRALTCLSRYGDEVTVYGTPEGLSLSATNSSKSAYCRFRYEKAFFSKYNIGDASSSGRRGPYADDSEEVVKGTIPAKALLSVLKNRASDKSVEKCELSIIEGNPHADEEEDSLESRLIVRLLCNYGVVKTHRLTLNDIESLLAPGISEEPNESRLTIGPKALKDLIDQFPSSKNAKSDPQLSWTFGDTQVQVKSHETSMEVRGAALSTELSIDSEEFDNYDIFVAPVSFAFHLREFSATIAYAESMSIALDLHFTEPAAPLFIDAECDTFPVESLFVISTSQPPGGAPQVSQSQSSASSSRKRPREPDSSAGRPHERRRPQKVVERTDAASLARQMRDKQSMPPPSLPFIRANGDSQPPPQREPLFLPSSQLSQADEQALRDSGLGDMNADEFNAMFDDEGVEVGGGMPDDDFMMPPPSFGAQPNGQANRDSFELVDELGPTQDDVSQNSANRTFQPLFDD
ncbi:hypothetical protein PENSPDRAFT_625733 [Peniophora sp. CONT]|nr:hypothetical protein PENSPDRAFT_625733 [Peniophora sp. CONT]